MINPKQLSRLLSALILAFAVVVAPAPEYGEALAAIETAIEARRKELGVPGASLVIVKDDKIIYMKGLGLKDIDRKLPVTPDTLFAIGSASKAFTAMAAVISVDESRMSLGDSPKKIMYQPKAFFC